MRVICDLVKPAPNAEKVAFHSFADGPEGGRYYDCRSIANMRHTTRRSWPMR